MTVEKNTLPESIVARIHERAGQAKGKSYLISILQEVQTHFGYLPSECLDEVSQLMQIPSAKVTGVASFYHFFSFEPKGKHRVTVCMGTACFVRGAERVQEKICDLLGIKPGETTADGEFSVESARCLGACAMAPVVLVDERVYGNVTAKDIPAMLAEHGFKPVPELEEVGA